MNQAERVIHSNRTWYGESSHQTWSRRGLWRSVLSQARYHSRKSRTLVQLLSRSHKCYRRRSTALYRSGFQYNALIMMICRRRGLSWGALVTVRGLSETISPWRWVAAWLGDFKARLQGFGVKHNRRYFVLKHLADCFEGAWQTGSRT